MPKQLSPRQVFTNPVHLLAFGFGSGLLPKAPGTAGTVVGVLVYLLLLPLPHWAYWLVTVVLFAAGVYICGYSAAGAWQQGSRRGQLGRNRGLPEQHGVRAPRLALGGTGIRAVPRIRHSQALADPLV